METAKIVLEYLKVLLSAPVIVGVVVFGFFVLFKEDIRGLLKRTSKIKFPGGSEFSTSQLEKENEELPTRGEQPSIVTENATALPPNLTLTPDQIKIVEEAFNAERAKAALWEYRYLNFFLARSTQRVLDWLASLAVRTTTSLFDTFWLPLIPSAEERRAIINALQAHHLISFTGEVIEVTPKGREYLQWRGPLPDDTT